MTSQQTEMKFEVRDCRRRETFWIDDQFVDSLLALLGPHASAVYIVLVRHADRNQECWPSQETVARKSGLSKRQVVREIRKLINHDLIEISRHRPGRAGQRGNNVYRLLDKGGWKSQPRQPSASQSPGTKCQPELPPSANDDIHQVPPSHSKVVNNREGTTTTEKDGGAGKPAPSDGSPFQIQPHYIFKTDPLSQTVYAYKKLKVSQDNRAWDRRHWPRAAKSAKLLLEFCHGSAPHAEECIASIAAELTQKGLDFTFETIVDRAPQWIEAQQKRQKTEKLEKENRRRDSQDSASQKEQIEREWAEQLIILKKMENLPKEAQVRIWDEAKAKIKETHFMTGMIREKCITAEVVEIYKRQYPGGTP